MATFSLFEFGTVTPAGDPVFPPSVTRTGVAVDTPTRLASSTVYVAVTPDTDMFFAVGPSNVTAGAGCTKVLAADSRGFNVSPGARPYVVGH